jgi:hypothetical protein
MSNRFDNKKLLSILGVLIIILLLTFILKVPKEKATLKGSLVELDTSDVSKIVIIPKISAGDPFEFVKENNKWTVRQGNIVSKPAEGAIQNILNEILSIKPQSLAAVDKSKWKEFELTDSLATKVKILNIKGKELADVLIGKFSYRQVANPYGYSGGDNIEGTSYVRVNNEKEIYAVEGFLAFSFNGKFSDWRDKTFIRCKTEDIIKITFTFPGDSSYLLIKKDSGWLAGDMLADSINVSNYLNELKYINGQDFKDDFRPASNPEYQMIVEGNNLLSFSVKCFSAEGTDDYILNSSLNPDVCFASKKNGIFSQVFKPEKYFFKK